MYEEILDAYDIILAMFKGPDRVLIADSIVPESL